MLIGVFELVPYGVCIALPFYLYQMTILRVVSIKAVYKFGWSEAILCAMPAWILAGLVFAALFLLASIDSAL